MKALILSVVLLSSVPALADYTGVVSGIKHFAGGGVAVDLDGKYPDQKMTLYVPPADVVAVGALPPEGARVTATGDTVQYHGKPEIKVIRKNQWKW